MNDLAHMIKRLAMSDSPIEHIDYKAAYGEDYEDIMHRRPDLTKFHHVTSFQFQWTLEKTLIDLINIKKEALGHDHE